MGTARVDTLVCGCEFNRQTRQWKFCEDHGQQELKVFWPLCACGKDFISEKNLTKHIEREVKKQREENYRGPITHERVIQQQPGGTAHA